MNPTNNNNEKTSTEKKGWLYKWVNYVKRYQPRYFVLTNGVLYYYKDESEVNSNYKGKINLASAIIKPLPNLNFLVSKGVHDSFHLRAENEVDKQKWLLSLNVAKSEASKNDDYQDYPDSNRSDPKMFQDQLKDDLASMFDKMQDIKACQQKLNKSGMLLQKLLTDFEIIDKDYYNDLNAQKQQNNSSHSSSDPAQPNQISELRSKLISDILKSFKEKNLSFKIAVDSTLNACNEFSLLTQEYLPQWCKRLEKEYEINRSYLTIINQLARDLNKMEKEIKKETNQMSSYSNDDDEKFYDAEEFSNENFSTFPSVPGQARRVSTTINNDLNATTKRNSIKYEIKSSKEPNELNKNSNNQLMNSKVDYTSYDQYTNESSDREDDELSLSSCNEEEEEDDHKLDEMIKSSVVLIDSNEIKLNDSFSRNSSSSNIIKFPNNEQNSQSSQDSDGSNRKHRAVVRQRRTRIPERPNHSLNLWSILKNSIGRDLSKIPMPVNFSEPLSLLQRITGDFEYADLLHKAAKIKDPCEQLAYVSAFCISNYATTGVRTNKPFNPLLLETFECDRLDDLGFRSIAEQVSHHPPILAINAEAKDSAWIVNSEFSITSKFRGKYLQVNPIDANHLSFPASNHHYTWNKVTTSVHNIIVGKLWIDNHGDMIITNHTTGDKAHIKFSPYSYFSRDTQRKVTGVVLDRESNPKWLIKGEWDTQIEVSKVLTTTQTDDDNQRIGRSVSKVIWKRNPFPPDSEKMYNLTKFAIELNEPEDGVAPTDSRLRPDQRLMEEGNWAEANHVKMLLEQKQRDARRKKEEEAIMNGLVSSPEHQPIWFTKSYNELIGNSVYQFNGDYWNKKRIQDWSMCPEIYDYSEYQTMS